MKKVLILLSNGFEILEAAAFIDVFGWANTFGSEQIEIITAGLHKKINCSFGLEVIPHAEVKELDIDSFDALIIPGGFEKYGFYKDAYSEEFLNLIRHFDKNRKPIAAICVGALVLGKSGILSNRSGTTYQLLEGKRKKQLTEMGVKVLEREIVRDGNVITSTSPATAIEVAFLLLEELTSGENAERIKRLMGFK